ncbi:MAG: peptide chain release factor-like protein, partial [Clostridium sp.]
KSVTLKVKGEYAYGYLKAEKGIHRLVRISPFNSNGKRQTSFASLEVLPELTKNQDIEIRPEDLKIDTFRASGAGGQHVNKTESAIRITHIKTGIVVQCQNERSQYANKDTAMTMLKSKLIELKDRAHKEKIEDLTGELKDMGWGSQIRSYVFHPYNLVKDHRTNEETGNLGAVMNGDIDNFITAYLKLESN